MSALRPYHPDDHEAVAALMALAFRDDPAYRFLLGEHVDAGLAFLMPRLLKLRRDAGARIDVHERDGRPVGVLVSAPPDLQLGTLGYLRNGLLRAPGTLGVAATMRLLTADRALHQLKNLVRPSEPWVEAVSLAVHPELGRGRGLRMAREALDGLDTGVLAVTTNARNVRLYEHMGFSIAAQNGVLGGFTAWVMLRPGPA
ncbi:MAG: GNAT family N-acetyltransferase [Alphaproteobacteria bacterium]|nr:GNAT family N-acetyltransferase [Alphaproteobacteria bacterium]